MTATQLSEIRRLVDAGGWDAVRRISELWTAWKKEIDEDRRYIDASDDFQLPHGGNVVSA